MSCYSMASSGSTLWLIVVLSCSSLIFSLKVPSKIVIGTRGSPLAMAQAEQTKHLLQTKYPELSGENSVIIKKIMTKGDAILNQPLSAIGGKGLFTKELDNALLDNEVDICVHSMKDVPTWLPSGTVLACYLPREETNDVFISQKYKTLSDLPDGAVIGSASLRRQAQLMAMNPTFKVINFRGNVQTRLKKLQNGDVDATLLALAGLKRLGMDDLVKSSCVIDQEDMLPAVAQGAIGIQCRSSDEDIVNILRSMNDPDTESCVECERSFLAELDGNCRTPIAGQASIGSSGVLHFQGMLAKADGSDVIFASGSGDRAESVAIGNAVACDIKEKLGPIKFKEFQDSYEV